MATLNELIKATSSAINEFEEALPFVEKQLASRVTKIISQLTLDRNGNIKPTVSNLRLLKSIKKEINAVLVDSKYSIAFSNLEKNLAVIDKVNEGYFSAMVADFGVPRVLKEAQNVAILELNASLKGAGIEANIVNRIVEMIGKDITGGAGFFDLNKSLREFILSTPEIPSRLSSYTKQVVVDGVHQYNAIYHEIVADDLGLDWFEYTGGLVSDSREWCVDMVAKRWVHRSEFPVVVKGIIDGHKVQIYKKTGLPQGMINGTNSDNLTVNRGGWNCSHLMNAVSTSRVPKEVQERIK